MSTEVEQQAREMGWVPQEEWRGDPEKWTDASTFVERGQTFVPFLKKERERLQGELAARDAQLAELGGAVKAANAAIEALQASHDEDVKEQVEAARKELKAQIVSAGEAGDHEGVAEATDKLTQLNAEEAARAATEKKEKETPAGDKGEQPRIHPEVASWMESNKDFVADQRNMRMANLIAQELRMKGDKRIGKAFMDDVRQQVEETLGTGPQRGGDGKASGGNGGGGRSEASGGGKGWADLPAEAKAACDRQASKVVGPNRKHKTQESWRKSYAEQYFSQP